MTVTADGETKLSEQEQERDQQTETANERQGKKRKSLPTCKAKSRRKLRSEASSHQPDCNERMKQCWPKAKTLNIADYVSIKIDKVGKTPLHPNVLIGEILAFENDYAKVACKFGIISTLISPARLVKCQATNVVISKDKNMTFTKHANWQTVSFYLL